MSKKKTPREFYYPAEGDRVLKLGFGHVGTVARVAGTWVWVEWDLGKLAIERPTVCSARELGRFDG